MRQANRRFLVALATAVVAGLTFGLLASARVVAVGTGLRF
jgi:hypothetical protein